MRSFGTILAFILDLVAEDLLKVLELHVSAAYLDVAYAARYLKRHSEGAAIHESNTNTVQFCN
jgi:hypothetical protein